MRPNKAGQFIPYPPCIPFHSCYPGYRFSVFFCIDFYPSQVSSGGSGRTFDPLEKLISMIGCFLERLLCAAIKWPRNNGRKIATLFLRRLKDCGESVFRSCWKSTENQGHKVNRHRWMRFNGMLIQTHTYLYFYFFFNFFFFLRDLVCSGISYPINTTLRMKTDALQTEIQRRFPSGFTPA